MGLVDDLLIRLLLVRLLHLLWLSILGGRGEVGRLLRIDQRRIPTSGARLPAAHLRGVLRTGSVHLLVGVLLRVHCMLVVRLHQINAFRYLF